MRLTRLFISLSLFLVACNNQVTPTQTPFQNTSSPVSTTQPVVTQTMTASPTLPQAISCDDWQSWPVVPIMSERARDLYRRGQVSGNNPRAFSKIGDGEISTEWFFTAF